MTQFEFNSEFEPETSEVTGIETDNYRVDAEYGEEGETVAYLSVLDVGSKGRIDQVHFHIPSVASAEDVADLINEDDNIGNEVLLNYPPRNEDERVHQEVVDATEVENDGEIVDMSHGYTVDEPRYTINYGNRHHDDSISEEGRSTFTIHAVDMEEVEEDVAHYVQELHDNPEVAEAADEIVSESLAEMDELTQL